MPKCRHIIGIHSNAPLKPPLASPKHWKKRRCGDPTPEGATRCDRHEMSVRAARRFISRYIDNPV